MLNLLPPQQKKEILEEERWKLVLVSMTVVSFCFAALIFILLLVDIVLLSNLEIQKINFNHQEKSPDVLQTEIMKSKLSEFNQTIFALEEFYQNQFTLIDTIKQLSDLLISSDLYLTDFKFVALPPQEDNSTGQISLTGFAAKREYLLSFKKNLEQSANFHGVNFPASNWVKPADINFTATFKVK